MIEIRDLLIKFNDVLLSEEGKRESIRKVVSKITAQELNLKDIKIKNNIIYLDIKPIYKNEIFLKRDEIFLELKKLFKKTSPTALL